MKIYLLLLIFLIVMVGMAVPKKQMRLVRKSRKVRKRKQQKTEIVLNETLISKVYWDANLNRILTNPIKDGNLTNYIPEKKLGAGAFSTVYLGKQLDTNDTVVIKILKQTNKHLVNREIQVLDRLNNKSEHIVQMRDKIRSQNRTNATIIYNYTNGIQFSSLVKKMSYQDIKRYLKQLLVALDVTHQNGVIHRDVKLSNTIVNMNDGRLQLIDWGLSEFYIPQQGLNPRAGTRFYKAPELLLEYRYFDYSIDMWSFGIIVAQIVFHKKPMFHGTNSTQQLVSIAKQLGTQELYDYANKYSIEVKDQVKKAIKSHQRKDWGRYCRKKNHCSEDSLDLISRLLVYDHKERLTAQEAMEHPYFN